MIKTVGRVGLTLALAGAVAGYLLVWLRAPETGCGPVTLEQLGFHCSFFDSLIYRLGNLASVGAAALFAVPGAAIALFAAVRSDEDPSEVPPQF
jgi:hypothetical protein